MPKRKYDVIVWGATGFTGKWVAKHLFDQYSQKQLNWAIAGRNPVKLEKVREFIGDDLSSVDILLADSDEFDSLLEMVAQTKVIISTVGPYAYYGSELIEACVTKGTDYVDLCGEVPWMREMIDTYQSQAQQSGARIVHSCGFDSIPSDMGNYFIQTQAHAEFGCYLQQVRYSLTKVKGGISGGTFASMLNIIKLAVEDKQVRKLLLNPYSLNPDPSFNGVDGRDQSGAVFNKELNKWTAPFIMSAINTRIVRRSNALLGYRYGDDFSYTETMPTSAGPLGFAAAQAISITIASMAFIGLTEIGRMALGVLLPSRGKGPKIDPEKPGFYHIQFNGQTSDGRTMVAIVGGDSDPGYGSTSKMLAESAVCLALDKLATKGGFWTASSAMDDKLLTRLSENAGLSFNLVE